MPQGIVLARGLAERLGESTASAWQESATGRLESKDSAANHQDAMKLILKMLTDTQKGPLHSLDEINAVGHRVVHGGEKITGAVLITPEIEDIIKDHSILAPLHNPPNLTGIHAARAALGPIPQAACFDTAFHQSIPQKAYLYGLPLSMYTNERVRKYGFHGTSHEYVARRAALILGKNFEEVNLITCHLGNGCSVCAVEKGKSVDTSMGLTPLEGLVMGTRTGDLDPASIFHLMRRGYKAEDLDRIFNKESGLLGLSGISNDVRDLEDQIENPRAVMALDIFAYRVKKYLGSYMAVLNKCDAIVLTGGIGENGWAMRARALSHLGNIGIWLDAEKNKTAGDGEAEISEAHSPVKILVVPTDEEKAIAESIFKLINTKTS